MKSVIHVYVDTKLEGLKKGFYILNKLLQANSPDVYARLRTERVIFFGGAAKSVLGVGRCF
jgi:hypothetical protein